MTYSQWVLIKADAYSILTKNYFDEKINCIADWSMLL